MRSGLARAGARILAVDKDLERAAETAQMIVAEGGKALAHAADMTEEADAKATAELAMEKFGRVDVLDNNVGIGSSGTVVDEVVEVWERVMRVNVQSMFLAAMNALVDTRGLQSSPFKSCNPKVSASLSFGFCVHKP